MELRAGAQFKHYTLERKLGSGSSAEVWQAHDTSKWIALKILNQDLLERDDVEKHRARLSAEITALQRLEAAHVPKVYAYDLHYDRPYLTMQFIEGEPFDRLIAKGTILDVDLTTRFEALSAVGTTLDRVHQAGIVHRDIKPANIKGFAPAYLLDFGIALNQDALNDVPADVGTGIYMPPADEAIDRSSDIYAFGLVVYEVLFGQHPLFTPATIERTVMGTRQRAGDLIRNHNWRVPSRIPQEALPPPLQSLDLSALDRVFEQILCPRSERYPFLAPLLSDLETALHTRKATPQPHVPFTVQPIPIDEHFTAQEVEQSEAKDARSANSA